MFYKLIFQNLPTHKKEKGIQKHGISLGTRFDGERTLYLYMIRNFFVEVTYKEDNEENNIEDLKVFSNHKELNSYLVQHN